MIQYSLRTRTFADGTASYDIVLGDRVAYYAIDPADAQYTLAGLNANNLPPELPARNCNDRL